MENNTDAQIEYLYEGAEREIAQAEGEEQLGFQKELDDHLNQIIVDERREWEELESDLDQLHDDYEEILAEQESNYCRELLEMSN